MHSVRCLFLSASVDNEINSNIDINYLHQVRLFPAVGSQTEDPPGGARLAFADRSKGKGALRRALARGRPRYHSHKQSKRGNWFYQLVIFCACGFN